MLTFGVFGVMPSYLACVEHIRHVFRQNKSFDENNIFWSKIQNFDFFHSEIYQNSWKMMNFQHFPLLELVNPLTIDQNQCKWWIFVRRKIHTVLRYIAGPTHVCLEERQHLTNNRVSISGCKFWNSTFFRTFSWIRYCLLQV